MSKIKIDPIKCIGCGLCVSMAEEVFKMNDDGKGELIDGYDTNPNCPSCGCCAGVEEKIKEAAEACPVQAIIINGAN